MALQKDEDGKIGEEQLQSHFLEHQIRKQADSSVWMDQAYDTSFLMTR